MIKHKHHKVPRYEGGSNDSENLIEVTPEEHAQIHKERYLKYGNWQDKVAWQGLEGLISGDECQEMAMIEGGRKGGFATGKSYPKGTRGHWNFNPPGHPFAKGNQLTAKSYMLIDEHGLIFEVHGLSKWCRENDINMKSFHKQVIERKRSHKGYKLVN